MISPFPAREGGRGVRTEPPPALHSPRLCVTLSPEWSWRRGRYGLAPCISATGQRIWANTTTCGREEQIFMETTVATSSPGTGTQGNGAGLGLIGTGELVKNYIGGRWVEA